MFNKITFLSVFLFLLTSCGGGGSPSNDVSNIAANPSTPNNIDTPFTDSKLQACINTELGLAESAIPSDEQLLSLTELTCGAQAGIRSLEGIEKLSNLEKLFIYESKLTDIKPLAALTNLKFLAFDLITVDGRQPLKDISPLAGLKKLETLFLGINSIEDVSPLAGLINLKHLALNDNSIEDISPLAKLVNLTTLDLADNAISDLSPLKNLTKLSRLRLTRNPLMKDSLDILSGLSQLKGLEIKATETYSIIPLLKLSHLNSLHIQNNHIPDHEFTLFNPSVKIYGKSDQTTQPSVPPVASSTFPDSNLSACINTELGLSESAIPSDEQLLLLTKLNCSGKEISSLEGIEKLSNLETLNLYNNKLTDIKPLAALTNLRILSLGLNTPDGKEFLKDITPLAGLVKLEELSLGTNLIKDITPLTKLVNLTSLGLSFNAIRDLSPLENLSKLSSLSVGENPLMKGSLDIVSGLSQLTRLLIDRTGITSIIPLLKLSNLETLYLQDNYIPDHEFSLLNPNIVVHGKSDQTTQPPVASPIFEDSNLSACINETLSLPASATPSDDQLRRIYKLDCSGKNISHLGGIAKLQYLDDLTLNQNEIKNISPLTDLRYLRRLRMYENQVTDLSPLSGSTLLQYIILGCNQIQDLSPLASLTSLKGLSIEHNQIHDISPLSGLTELEYLLIYKNKISDVTPLANLTNLKRLDFSRNQVGGDLSELSNLQKLEILKFNNNKVTTMQNILGILSLKEIYLKENYIPDNEFIHGGGVDPARDLIIVGVADQCQCQP